ncbi:hypothetical protein [Pseudomonas sp. NPDC089569]|uniref:hypothetical protein n=1 Tax=Pseudomonas sp. NPDC089569 TaxID=3390722 RepID=UPI003D06B1F5
MHGLKVKTWQEWEELCCHFMQRIAQDYSRVPHRFTPYGDKGQRQHGIDVIQAQLRIPLVGQCKHMQNLTWREVLKELEKTDSAPFPIAHYYVFTTSDRKATIQDLSQGEGYHHKRPDGTTFKVHVIFWDDVKSLDFVPEEVRRRIFPGAFQISRGPEQTVDIRPSLEVMKSYIPTRITAQDLKWLDSWDFGSGIVHEKDFAPFDSLWREYRDVLTGIEHNNNAWMFQDNLRKIGDCMPAADNFFRALHEFRQAIHGFSAGLTLPDESNGLSITDIAGWPKIARQWKAEAECVAAVYRRDILGLAAE